MVNKHLNLLHYNYNIFSDFNNKISTKVKENKWTGAVL